MFHVGIMIWYYSHDSYWKIDNKAVASFWFFGISFMLVGCNMFISASNRIFPIQEEITKFHAVFIMLLGSIYATHYSGIMITTDKEKLIMIVVGVIAVLIIILISAWRHGFFNSKTYDGG